MEKFTCISGWKAALPNAGPYHKISTGRWDALRPGRFIWSAPAESRLVGTSTALWIIYWKEIQSGVAASLRQRTPNSRPLRRLAYCGWL